MTLRRLFSQRPHPDEGEARPNRRALIARRCFQLALLLLILGLVPTVLAIWGEQRATANAVWRDPASSIEAAAVAPDLALLGLAGVPDDEVLALAMEKGELATVHALLALGANLIDRQRTDGWLWLAYRFHQAGQTQKAAQAYRMAGDGAILGWELSDLQRVTTLLAVGRGLTELHDKQNARFFLGQAAVIGAYAPHLQTYHRRLLLEQLLPASVRAGGKRDDWMALAQTVKSGTPKGGNVTGSHPAGGQTWYNVPSTGDAALVQARDARRAAAGALLNAMPNGADYSKATRSGTVEDAARKALRDALLAEENAVLRFVEQRGGVSAYQERLHWLLLKRRIAAGGAGVGLVPEWESNQDGIEAALTAAWTDWLALQSASTGVSIADDYSGLPAHIAHQAIVAAYWGLYPNAPVTKLVPAAKSGSGFGRLRMAVLEPGTPPVVGWSE